jgi:hypothetical protein
MESWRRLLLGREATLVWPRSTSPRRGLRLLLLDRGDSLWLSRRSMARFRSRVKAHRAMG